MEGRELAVTVSADITEDAVVTASPALYFGAQLLGGTADSSLVIYDNATEAAGTVIDRLSTNAVTNAGDVEVFHDRSKPVNCTAGIFVDWTGTAAIGKVYYQPK